MRKFVERVDISNDAADIRLRTDGWCVTKPRGRCATSPGIPADAHAPVRCPSDFVFPEDRGSLRRRQYADQSQDRLYLRPVCRTARRCQHSIHQLPNHPQKDAVGIPNQVVIQSQRLQATSWSLPGWATAGGDNAGGATDAAIRDQVDLAESIFAALGPRKKAVNWRAKLIFSGWIFNNVARLEAIGGTPDGQANVEVGDDRKDCCGKF